MNEVQQPRVKEPDKEKTRWNKRLLDAIWMGTGKRSELCQTDLEKQLIKN